MTIAISVATSTSPPLADLGLTGLPAGTVSVRVTRSWSSTSETIRARCAIAGSTGHVIDHDVPLGRELVWTASALSSSGGLLEVATSPATTVAAPATGLAWISDPMSPRSAMLLSLLYATDGERNYGADVRASRRLGNRLPVAVTSARQAPARTIGWATETAAETYAMEDLIASGLPLLVRCSEATMLHRTGLLYLASGSITRAGYWPAEFADWLAPGFEAAGPSIPAVVHPWTYADLKALGGTYADLKARYAGKTYLDLARNA